VNAPWATKGTKAEKLKQRTPERMVYNVAAGIQGRKGISGMCGEKILSA
jgi:hypothetical protein